VTETVRVPEPVYDELSRIAERKDISRGAVVQDWREKAQKYEEMEGRHR